MSIEFAGNTQEIIVKFEQTGRTGERKYPYFIYTKEGGQRQVDIPGNKLSQLFAQIKEMDSLTLAQKINKAGGLVLNENYEVI